MATFYSDNIHSTGIAANTLQAPSRLKDSSIVHTRGRVKRMEVSFVGSSPAPAVNDIVRMGTFKPTDRIYKVLLMVKNLVVAGATADIGFYETGARYNGIVADQDLLASAIALSAVANLDVFGCAATGSASESATIGATDRGLPISAWLDIGRADTVYSTQKRDIQLDLCLTLLGTQATAAGVLILEVVYVSGD